MSKYTLPNGVTIAGKLYNEIEMDEIRGRHQNMLVNPKAKTPIDFVEPILKDLVLDLRNSDQESILNEVSKQDLILHQLPIQDIQFILIKVRQESYGPEYLMHLKCTHCDADNDARLDLSTLAVSERIDKLKPAEMILPKDKTVFRYGHMSLAHLLKIAVEDDKEDITKELITGLTSFMISRLGENVNVKPSDLDDLKGSDIDFMQDNMPILPEPDMKITHKCKSCEKDFDSELPVMAADFLRPSRT